MTQQRDGSLRASSVERARAERYRLRQLKIRRGASGGERRAHLSEFKASGFSIPGLASRSLRRVGRLINAG
jgi:hypothetical protein